MSVARNRVRRPLDYCSWYYTKMQGWVTRSRVSGCPWGGGYARAMGTVESEGLDVNVHKTYRSDINRSQP
jgi:hypothetical protein